MSDPMGTSRMLSEAVEVGKAGLGGVDGEKLYVKN